MFRFERQKGGVKTTAAGSDPRKSKKRKGRKLKKKMAALARMATMATMGTETDEILPQIHSIWNPLHSLQQITSLGAIDGVARKRGKLSSN